MFGVAVAVLSLLPILSFAQPLDTRHKVDTLTFAERLSVRTNGTDWVLMIPNIGIEFDIRNKNWNRWAVNLNLRYRPGSNTKSIIPMVYEGKEIKLEGRMYWRERQARPTGILSYHTMPWDKLMSCRRMVPKHPNTVYYRGLYVSYGDYALRLGGNGHRGEVAQAGITWGFVRPLYTYGNGNSIDMEIGISGGVAYAKDRRFSLDTENNEYRDDSPKQTRVLPMVNDLHAALVYRFGKYPIRKKYRWRYDVDMDFRSRIDSVWNKDEANKILKHHRDSMYKVIAKDFRLTYDSIISHYHKEKQERIDRSAPARKTGAEAAEQRKKNVEVSPKKAVKKEEE